MKKRDFILILIVILIAGVVWFLTNFIPQKDDGILQISVNGTVYGVYDLNQSIVIDIGTTNTCQIDAGHVSMIYADCPDQVCVHSLDISKSGQTIICMPNKIVLEILDGETNQIDTIAE